MSRVFITGSADGLGQMAAKLLVDQGHKVVLHARNADRGRYTLSQVPGAESVLTGDLSDLEETKELSKRVNGLGAFDAVIHNAGVYQGSSKSIFTVNTLSPYILTCLIENPKRLIYLSSGMHRQGDANPAKLTDKRDHINYSDSKLYVLMLCMAVARLRPEVYSNAVDPGWVPTKMGGPGAPDNLEKGVETQAWLAVSDDAEAKGSGRYFYHKRVSNYNSKASEVMLQDKLLQLCEGITGVHFPHHPL